MPPVVKKTTVNLTKRAADALEGIREQTGENATDAINKALALYGVYVHEMEEGNKFQILKSDGSTVVVIIL